MTIILYKTAIFYCTLSFKISEILASSPIFSFPKANRPEKWLINTFKNCSLKFYGNSLQWNTKLVFFSSQITVISLHHEFYKTPLNPDLWTYVNRSKPHPHNIPSKWHLDLRYRLCSVKLFYLEYPNMSSAEYERIINSALDNSKLFEQNPDIIVLPLSGSKARSYEDSIKNILRILPITSIPIIIPKNVVKIVHLYSDQDSVVFDLSIKISMLAFSQLQNIWNGIIRNFHQASLFCEGSFFYFMILGKDGCSMRFAGIYARATLCTKIELGSKFNYSIVPFLFRENTISNNAIMSSTTMNDTFLKTKWTRFHSVWIPYGCEYNSYTYSLFVTKKHVTNIRALIQPFDVPSTYTILFSIFSIFGLLYILYNKSSQATTIGLKRRIYMFQLKSIAEQSDPRMLKLLGTKYGGCIGVSAWLIAFYILGNDYKGYMYSCMTTIPTPDVPETIADLVMNSNIPYFTSTKHYYNDDYYSTLKDLVLFDYLRGQRQTYLTSVIRKFRGNCVLLKGSPFHVIYNVTNHLEVETDMGMRLVPSKFALISREKDLTIFATLMEKVMDIFVLPSKSMSQFNSPVPWFGKRDHFTQVFSEGLGLLEQAGIYQRWVKNSKLIEVVDNLHQMDDKLNVSRENRDNHYAMVLYMTNFGQNKAKISSSPISLESLDQLLIGCSVVAVISVVVFGLERLVAYVKKLLC